MLNDFPLYSYGAAAIVFLSLAAALATFWRTRSEALLLGIASLVTAIWAGLIVIGMTLDLKLNLLLDLFEIVRNLTWVAFLLKLHLVSSTGASFKFARNGLFNQFHTLIGIFFLAQLLVTSWSHFYVVTGWFGKLLLMLLNVNGGGLVSAVIGLWLIENFFRNVSSKGRWGIKFACLGMGGMFAYDFYLYSDAMLFKKINLDLWAARGAVDALMAPLIAISVARGAKWSQGMLISRKILFHSVTLFGAAFYLLAMAAAGYYLRFFGGSWGAVVQVTFLFGAVVLLLILLFSGSARSWLRVFISKHFYHYSYDYREVWMRLTRILTEHPGELSERSIQALAELVESPAGVLYLKTNEHEFVAISQWNTPSCNVREPIDSHFCRLLEEKKWIIDLNETEQRYSMHQQMQMPVWLKEYPRAWLIVPLLLHEQLFGFVILEKARSKIKLNWEMLDLFRITGSQIAGYLAQQAAADALSIARQFDSFNRMSTFMVHDLKNLVSQLSLLMANAEKHKDKPEFQQDMLATIEHSVQKMKVLLQKLARGMSDDLPAYVQLDQLLQEVINSKAPYEPKPRLSIRDSDIQIYADKNRLERVIGHVIQNAIEATPSDGDVEVTLKKENESAVIEVKDNGIGMSEEFIREKLFNPFVSTKVAGMGVGVFETKEYLSSLGGKLEVSSFLHAGSVFRMIFPMQQQVYRGAA